MLLFRIYYSFHSRQGDNASRLQGFKNGENEIELENGNGGGLRNGQERTGFKKT